MLTAFGIAMIVWAHVIMAVMGGKPSTPGAIILAAMILSGTAMICAAVLG